MPSFNKLVIRGSIADTEEWSCSVNFAAVGGGSNITSQGDLNLAAEAAFDYLVGSSGPVLVLRGMLSTVVSIDGCTLYYYPTIGGPAGGVGESTGLPVDGTGTVENVAQVACVCSLQTLFPGRRFRGRFYWPAIGASIGSSLQMGDPDAAGAATAFAGALAGLRDVFAVYGEVVPVVVSTVGDELTAVSSVSVDSILDTQRRRSKGLTGSRSTALIP